MPVNSDAQCPTRVAKQSLTSAGGFGGCIAANLTEHRCHAWQIFLCKPIQCQMKIDFMVLSMKRNSEDRICYCNCTVPQNTEQCPRHNAPPSPHSFVNPARPSKAIPSPPCSPPFPWHRVIMKAIANAKVGEEGGGEELDFQMTQGDSDPPQVRVPALSPRQASE